MRANDYLLKQLSLFMYVGIYQFTDKELVSYEKNAEVNPLTQNETLQNHLISCARKQEIPYIYADEYNVYFAAIANEDSVYLIGPMSLRMLNRVELYHYYCSYEIDSKSEKKLHNFSFSQIINMIKIIATIILEIEYTDDKLIHANHLTPDIKSAVAQEQIIFSLKKGEEELYHHTYQEEYKLLECVKEGRVDEAITHSRNMDMDLGKLSKKERNHWKNAAIVAITLCTRAAITGGLSPAIAYHLSDFYIQKTDCCEDIVQLLEYRNQAVRELTGKVKKILENKKKSTYVERCKDYVAKHYQEKIYQNEIAQTMHIGSTYLSRLFHKETGICLQDYIVQVRLEHSENLLLYSDESIARIAEYVNFPSQSYYGQIFKKKHGMSPKKYRELYKPSEF